MDVCVTVSELWTTRPNGPAGGADGGAPSWFAEEPQPGSNEQAAKDAAPSSTRRLVRVKLGLSIVK
jgi:hypothetical protein